MAIRTATVQGLAREARPAMLETLARALTPDAPDDLAGTGHRVCGGDH